MKRQGPGWELILRMTALALGMVLVHSSARADPEKYQQWAQQKLPQNVTPSFISVGKVVVDIKAGNKPFIIDVRPAEEFREAHILGAVSAPLSDFHAYIKHVPKDRLVVLY